MGTGDMSPSLCPWGGGESIPDPQGDMSPSLCPRGDGGSIFCHHGVTVSLSLATMGLQWFHPCIHGVMLDPSLVPQGDGGSVRVSVG